MQDKIKLNLGCGTDIRKGYINCDKFRLAGVDKIIDLDKKIDFADSSIDEILAIDVLEHVTDIIFTMEELHRVLKPSGKLFIQVPYWNSWCAVADPTHKRGFHERFFNFFDPQKEECRDKPYYTKARFKIISLNPVLYPFSPFLHFKKKEIKNKSFQKLFFLLANYINNIVIDLNLVLQKI